MPQGSRLLGGLVLALAVASGAVLRPLGAQQTASQLVIFRILPASHASVAPMTKPMSLQGAQDESRGSWSIATSQPDRKIVASLDRALSRGSALVVTLTPPAGAMSAGPVVLDTTAADVVTGIPITAQSELPLHYLVNGNGSDPQAPTDAQALTEEYTVVPQP
jgi:hypothetical protein